MLEIRRFGFYVGIALVTGWLSWVCYARASTDPPPTPVETTGIEEPPPTDKAYVIINFGDDGFSLQEEIKNRPVKQLVGQEFLELAATSGHLEQLKVLLKAGVPPAGYENQNQALYLAARQGRTNIVRELIRSGAKLKLNDGTERYRSPLMAAIASGTFETVKVLLDAGARLDDPIALSPRRYRFLTTASFEPSQNLRPMSAGQGGGPGGGFGGGFGDGPMRKTTAQHVLRVRNDKFARQIQAYARTLRRTSNSAKP